MKVAASKNKDRPKNGQTFVRWADWDGSYRGNVRLQVHESRRACTYGLKPFKVKITIL